MPKTENFMAKEKEATWLLTVSFIGILIVSSLNGFSFGVALGYTAFVVLLMSLIPWRSLKIWGVGTLLFICLGTAMLIASIIGGFQLPLLEEVFLAGFFMGAAAAAEEIQRDPQALSPSSQEEEWEDFEGFDTPPTNLRERSRRKKNK
jgi:hypothetical protein